MGYQEVDSLIHGAKFGPGGTGAGMQYRYSVLFTPAIFPSETKGLFDRKTNTDGNITVTKGSFDFTDIYIWPLNDPTTLAAVSLRAYRVTPPRVDFKVNQLPLGILQYPLLQGLSIEQFSITFVDTEDFMVRRWFSAWVNSLFPKDGTVRSLVGRCMQCSITAHDGTWVPVAADIYPRVIPSSIVHPDWDNEGGAYMITVNFLRIPIFNIPKRDEREITQEREASKNDEAVSKAPKKK